MKNEITHWRLKSILVFKLLTGLFPFAALAQVQMAPGPHFDELFHSKGSIKQQYELIDSGLLELKPEQVSEFLRQSRKDFKGDNALNPIPRVLTRAESAELQNGVAQRAKALVAFLKDLHSGTNTFAAQGIVPEAVVNRIMDRAGELSYLGQVDPKQIAFMYGPDIIRDQKGKWRVIEDNPGFIGGIGDLPLAYDLMMKKYPKLAISENFISPLSFYQKLSESLKAQARKHKGKAIVFMAPPYADNEDHRIRDLFKKFDIETITPHSRIRLEITDAGVFTYDSKDPNGPRERVGYIFQNGEHASLDRTMEASRIRYFMELAQDYLKESDSEKAIELKLRQLISQYQQPGIDPAQRALVARQIEKEVRDIYIIERTPLKGLFSSIAKKQVGSNYSAGVDFIGDKEFYVYIEELIRFYLKEEPILKNIPTEKLASSTTGQVRTSLVNAVLKNPKDYVLKRVDGRGGDAVWVGSKLTEKEMKDALDKAMLEPDVFILQKYTPLSVLSDQIVDLRSITAVMPNEVIVSPVPWGRGLPMNGNGKVNLSDQGREVTILIERSDRALIRSCGRVH